MGRRATCFDNAVAESFFATYKKSSSTPGHGSRGPMLTSSPGHTCSTTVRTVRAAWSSTVRHGRQPLPAIVTDPARAVGRAAVRVTDRGGSSRRWRRVMSSFWVRICGAGSGHAGGHSGQVASISDISIRSVRECFSGGSASSASRA